LPLHLLLAADDDFVAVADADRDRRPPPVARLARCSPDFATRTRIESGDERAAVLILVEDDAVLVEQGRSRGAVIRLHRAQIALPDDLAVEIEGEQPAGAEGNVDALAIRRGGGGGVAVLVVRA
jgi:hypothetical protein